MKQGRTLLGLAICAVSLVLPVAVMAQALTWTVQGAWVDPTPAGPEYVPVYGAQCQVGGVGAWEDLALPAPTFATVVTFDPASLFECRWRESNAIVTPAINGNWSAWTQGIVAQRPADPGGGTLILIRQVP